METKLLAKSPTCSCYTWIQPGVQWFLVRNQSSAKSPELAALERKLLIINLAMALSKQKLTKDNSKIFLKDIEHCVSTNMLNNKHNVCKIVHTFENNRTSLLEVISYSFVWKF